MLPGKQGNLGAGTVPAAILIVQPCSGALKSQCFSASMTLMQCGSIYQGQIFQTWAATPTPMRLGIDKMATHPGTQLPELQTWELSYSFLIIFFFLSFMISLHFCL